MTDEIDYPVAQMSAEGKLFVLWQLRDQPSAQPIRHVAKAKPWQSRQGRQLLGQRALLTDGILRAYQAAQEGEGHGPCDLRIQRTRAQPLESRRAQVSVELAEQDRDRVVRRRIGVEPAARVAPDHTWKGTRVAGGDR